MRKQGIFILLLFTAGLFSACNIEELLNKVEVSYDVDFSAEANDEAVISYYKPGGKLETETINPGEWSYNGIFSYGDKAGVWVESGAQDGYVNVYLVVWYSELTGNEDYVDANTWMLPFSGKKGLETSIDTTKFYPVDYTVTVTGTNGAPVEIQYTEKDYGSGSLLSETSLADGVWTYNDNFPTGGYASVNLTSEATSGTAIIRIQIDYDDKADVDETLTVDFSTSTKTGALGFPVE
ncbi:MAG: hypothetical protein JXR50_11105 [Prolixibacteraceae bacterium]|nr:hypothetical protein [Prolixibacteraceae bacterium]MBN2650275.1 hypothetical protein [Prolixibacteraceae bacterium]